MYENLARESALESPPPNENPSHESPKIFILQLLFHPKYEFSHSNFSPKIAHFLAP